MHGASWNARFATVKHVCVVFLPRASCTKVLEFHAISDLYKGQEVPGGQISMVSISGVAD